MIKVFWNCPISGWRETDSDIVWVKKLIQLMEKYSLDTLEVTKYGGIHFRLERQK